MNRTKKILIIAGCLSVLSCSSLLAGRIGSDATGVQAASTGTAWQYGISGTVAGGNWGAEIKNDSISSAQAMFTWVDDSETYPGINGYFETTFSAETGNLFKIVALESGKNWSGLSWIGWNNGEYGLRPDILCDYFSDAGGSDHNVLVNESGTYTIRITEGLSNDQTNLSNLLYIGREEADDADIRYHYNDGSTEIVKVKDGLVYDPKWVREEGKTTDFYSDSSFSTKWDFSTKHYADASIGADVYVEKGVAEDVVVYYQGNYDYIYWFNDYGYNGVDWESRPVMEVLPEELSYVENGTTVSLKHFVIDGADQPSMIIFSDETGGYGHQTADLQVAGPKGVYSDTGVLADSSDKVGALDFIAYWRVNVRTSHEWNGEELSESLCWLLEDNEAWTKLSTMYNDPNLTEAGRLLVDPVIDVEGCTIGESMEYLANAHSEPAVGPAASIFFSEPENVAGITAGVLVLVSILGFSVFYFVRRRKHASN